MAFARNCANRYERAAKRSVEVRDSEFDLHGNVSKIESSAM